MSNFADFIQDARPAGYVALTERFQLRVIRNWHRSYIAAANTHRVHTQGALVEEVFPAAYWLGETLAVHLEFALKYDGVNLALLDLLFAQPVEAELLDYLRAKPTGKYARKLWFLYEFLTGKVLPLDDLKQGNYVDLLDPEAYYTVPTVRRSRRHRVNDNLPGTREFCPIIRRTESLAAYASAGLSERCRDAVQGYSERVLRRALDYLYTKETKSSFAIEHEEISGSRIARFLAILQRAEREDFCDHAQLVALQNQIVSERFQEAAYRTTQNYVGETIVWNKQRIHFVSPKPEDVSGLLEGLIASHHRLEVGDFPPVLHAAAIAYGFVFIHPFEDGNGRIHRFLIHNILSRRGFTPPGLMFPISATMLRKPRDYDASLEAFSRLLTPVVNYWLDEQGQLTVYSDTARWYRYIDLTVQAEALYEFIESTIETELPRELAFLASYDATKRAIQRKVDMPDRKIDLFIQCCIQNGGTLSPRKREQFAFLTDEEVEALEAAVRRGYDNDRVREALAAYEAGEAI